MSQKDPKLRSLIPEQTLQQIMDISKAVSDLVPPIKLAQIDTMKEMAASISSIYSEDLLQVVKETAVFASKTSVESVHGLRDSLLTIQESLIRAISIARPYMNQGQIEKAESIVPDIFEDSPPQPDKPQKTPQHASIGTLIALLNLLFAIIFGIISLLPDDQLEQITEQNAVIIEQNQEMISQQEEKLIVLRQLLETAQDVRDTINALDQDIDNISDALEEFPVSADDLNEVADDLDKPVESEDEPTDSSRLNQTQCTED